MSQQRLDDAGCAAVAEGQSDHHGGRAEQGGQVIEVVVLGDEHEALRLGMGPDAAVIRAAQPFENDLARTGVGRLQGRQRSVREVFVEQQFHDGAAGRRPGQAACNQVVCRSRSAA